MKIIKKFGCFILALVICVSSVGFCVSAKSEKLPVVVVTGYSSCSLFINPNSPDEIKVWKPDIKEYAVSALKENPVKFAYGLGMMLLGNNKILSDIMQPYFKDILKYMEMNDDGSSKYDVVPYPHDVKDTSYTNIKKIYIPDYMTLHSIGAVAGNDNVYCCTMDWRKSQVDCAESLAKYIEEVLKITGKEKVNLFGVSFGGEVVSTYACLYGGKHINNLVMCVPAIGGTKVATTLLSGEKYDLSLLSALGFLEESMAGSSSKSDTDYQWISKIINIDFLNSAALDIINPYIQSEAIKYGSVWDLVPVEDYDNLKNKILDKTKNKGIIEKSDILHYEVMAKLTEKYRELQKNGVNISILAGTGTELVLDKKYDSDGVIDIVSATGANRKTGGNSCINSDHLHISPISNIDASSCYLPENTWFINGMLHSMGFRDKKTSKLITTLLMTDTIKDVHTSTDYPQFYNSEEDLQSVKPYFPKSLEGYMTKYDNKLVLKNLFGKSDISVYNVKCNYPDLKFTFDRSAKIGAGKSAEIGVYGEVPKNNLNIEITVEFIRYGGKLPVMDSKTFRFTFATDELENKILLPDADLSSYIFVNGTEPSIKIDGDTVISKMLFTLLNIFSK